MSFEQKRPHVKEACQEMLLVLFVSVIQQKFCSFPSLVYSLSTEQSRPHPSVINNECSLNVTICLVCFHLQGNYDEKRGVFHQSHVEFHYPDGSIADISAIVKDEP